MTTVRSRALVLVVVAPILAACTSSLTVSPTTTTKPIPAVDLSATPTGWVPVAYGDAQISVPASFSVIYPGQYPCGSFSDVGTIFLGSIGSPDACVASVNGGAQATVVYLREQRFPSESLSGLKSITRNGLRLYVASVDGIFGYYSPLLGVVAAASGPLAQQVLDSLTASPRVLALASGPAPKAPVTWHSVTFAGLRFLAPASWRVERAHTTPGLGNICGMPGVAFWQTAVVLSTDARRMIVPACPLERPFPQPPLNSVQVDSGLQTEPMLTLSFSTYCLSLHGLRTCPAISPAYSILVLKVTVPGRAKPVYVSIGLAGNGMVARTILYSLRVAWTRYAAAVTGRFEGVPDSPAPFFVCQDGDVTCFQTMERLPAFVEVYDIDKGFEFFDSQGRPLAVSREGRDVSVRADSDAILATARLSELLRAYFQGLPEKYHGYVLKASGARTLDELVELLVEFDQRPAPRGTWNKTVARLRRWEGSMHKLKHPIALFIVIVLAIIAIGVGIIVATGSGGLGYGSASDLLHTIGCTGVSAQLSSRATAQCSGPNGVRWQTEAFLVPPGKTPEKYTIALILGQVAGLYGSHLQFGGMLLGPNWLLTIPATAHPGAWASRIGTETGTVVNWNEFVQKVSPSWIPVESS
jgi:hypothetical protein